MITCDVLVLGGGIAGCSAALRAAELGADVVVVAKDSLGESNTAYAQGGIIGMPPPDAHDSAELLASDVEAAGAGLCKPEAVALLAEQGPILCREFLWKQVGVDFDHTGALEPEPTAEAAHSARRIWHVKDATGRAIQTALTAKVRAHPRIRIFESHSLVDLLTVPHHSRDPRRVYDPIQVWGAYGLAPDGQVRMCLARRTILATGGLGYLYLHTSNPASATGDGLAAAYRASARIVNCEYVQFHPTTLYVPGRPRTLLTEALRGEGAHLVNGAGERFMSKYAPEGLELAPRDVVSRAIFQEMAATGEPCMYLDLEPLKARLDLEARFPTVLATCRKAGLEPLAQPIPVVPAAHYFCGGVAVDLDGRASLPGLFAVGEVSCTGVHGANRLASSSLLEGLVWGYRAGEACATESRDTALPDPDSLEAWKPVPPGPEPDPLLIEQDWTSIRTTLWNYAGIVRTRDRLLRGRGDMGYLYHRIEAFYRAAPLSRSLLELRNGILCARLIFKAALQNPESRGCHYRLD
ncbi:L-aspartate oxidase [Mesoterricola silvestris]|uniref:L-aspartate oxidase n=1 Tax=Mesoterricola silvestris TaxID=2927979 RepID=A0AA48K8Q2_9BACT|nr:L-aspartate oxidase [Mesoterricola silvestris]BDU72576.1 L-aspartate oxidase [Mesoterricola silvestris]